MGGGSTKTTQTSEPWSGQKPFLHNAFDEAQDIYNKEKAKQQPGYKGNFVATNSPLQNQVFQNGLEWNNTTGRDAVNNTVAAGQQQLAQGQGVLSDVQSGLTDFRNKDWTQQHITNAGQYANNPFMDAMVQAASRDARQTFSEQTMRGIDQNAAMTGNLNATRAGVAAGIAQRGLTDTVGDLSAGLRGNAWTQGLQASQNDQGALLQALMGQGGLAQGQIQTGLGAQDQALQMGQSLADQNVINSTMLTQGKQAKIDNDIQKFDYKNSKAWQNLGNYWSIIGDKSWGGTTTSIQKTKSDPLSSIGAGIGILGSFMKCDARVKVVHGRMGWTKDQLFPLYLITYKDAPHMGMHITPMAQDVELQFPHAIREINGVKHIDTNVYDWRG